MIVDPRPRRTCQNTNRQLIPVESSRWRHRKSRFDSIGLQVFRSSRSKTMSTAASSSASKPPAKKQQINQEQIISGFNQLRQEQRLLGSRVVELESDASEHGLVIEALKGVDPNRKCFRLIGGVLVERKVEEVLPPLEKNKEMIGKLVENLKEQVVNKGKEITEYMSKNQLTIRQEPTKGTLGGPAASGDSNSSSSENQGTTGVLVGK